jgi:hypothetical protein
MRLTQAPHLGVNCSAVDTPDLAMPELVRQANVPVQERGQKLLEARQVVASAFLQLRPSVGGLRMRCACHERFVTCVCEALSWTVQVVRRRWR